MSRRLRLAGVALALVVTLAGVGAALPGERVLVVEDADTGERLLTTPVDNGETVTLKYTHSVEKSPVHEQYTVRGGEFVMTKAEFHSYGWGFPSRANVTNRNGTLVYDPPGRYETIPVMPGTIADHRLVVGGDRTYDLVALAGGENAVTLDVRRRSALETTLHLFS